MANTTPNKETIRRICLLHGGTKCYILVDTGSAHVDILTNIQNNNSAEFLSELESWCGMKFKVYSENNEVEQNTRIKQSGEMILPIKI